jgi:ribulose-phosphate 3-epimerase
MNSQTNSMNIYPAILTGDPQVVAQQVLLAQSSPDIQAVQLDIIDGIYRDVFTVTPSDLVGIDWGSVKLDLHLMVNEPIDYVHEAIEFRRELPIRAIVAQVERMSSQAEYLEEVKRHDWLAGLSLDYYTPLEAIDEESWEYLDVIQVMGNESGYQGRQLQLGALELVREVKQAALERDKVIEIMVDVGVKEQTIGQIAQAGATGAAAGSVLWKADDFAKKVSELLVIAEEQVTAAGAN